jgi:DNA-directed RNA polymerase subunit L
MSKNFDIKLEVKSYTPNKKFTSSSLQLEFTGKDVYPKLINTLSRVAANGIPSYAFPPQLINIEQNTCAAYDNQYMQLRLSNLPIYDVPLDMFHLHDKYWKNVNYGDLNREKSPLEKDIKMYLNVHNNSDQIQHITTNDIKMYIDGEETNKYNKEFPILLVKLRPNDSFKFNMTAALGIGELHAIWRAAVNSCAPYEDDKYFLHLHSNGQETEFAILTKSCKHVIKRLEDIKIQIEKMANEREIKNDSKLQLILDGEDHTMGEIINYELQSHPNLTSGVCKPDLLIKSVTFKLEAIEPSKMIKSIVECIDILLAKYKYILKLSSELKSV